MKPAVPAPVLAPAAPRRAPAPVRDPMEQHREYYASSNFRKLAAWCAAYLLFFRLSAIQQIIGIRGLQHGPALLGLAGAITAGGLYRMGLLRKPMIFWVGFWIWVAVGIPFSTWPGGTFGVVKSLITTVIPVPLIIVGSVMTWKECRRLAFAAALAGFTLAIISKLLVTDDSGRGAIDSASSISNSNDLAAILLLTIPFVLFLVLRPATNWFIRCGAFATIAYSLFQTVRTGSRGGMVAMCVMMLVILVRSTTKQRIGLIAGAVALFAVSFAVLPENITHRLVAFSDNSENTPAEAEASKEIRINAMKVALRTMFVRPIFGCGAGIFQVFANEGVVRNDVRDWHEVHNAYLRAGAESGIPALVLYVATFVWLFRRLGRVYRRARTDLRAKEIADLAHCFTIALAGFAVTMFFLPWQFEGITPTMSAFGIVFCTVAWRELSALGIPESAAMRRRQIVPSPLVAGGPSTAPSWTAR